MVSVSFRVGILHSLFSPAGCLPNALTSRTRPGLMRGSAKREQNSLLQLNVKTPHCIKLYIKTCFIYTWNHSDLSVTGLRFQESTANLVFSSIQTLPHIVLYISLQLFTSQCDGGTGGLIYI